MTRLRMLWRIALLVLEAVLRPREWARRTGGGLAILLAIPLAGCATTKPLSVACVSCALLQQSGLCPDAKALAAKRPGCPEGQRLEILNYQRWLDGQEAPRVACRRYSIQ